MDLYARCDGGTFGPYDFRPTAELADAATGELADAPGLEAQPGQWVRIGCHEYGHAILWDAIADEVALYSPDDMEPDRVGRTEEFLEQVFHPSGAKSADASQQWAEALAEADRLP